MPIDVANGVDQVKNTIPLVQQWGLSAFSTLTWLLIVLVTGAVATVLTIIYLQRKAYKYTIIKWEKVNGHWIDVGRDTAMEIKYGGLGQRILYWRKTKIYTPFPPKRTQLNKFYYKRNEKSSEWIPFTISDEISDNELRLDAMAGSMLYQNAGIRKGLKELFEKHNWIKENIVMISSMIFIVILGIMFWFLTDKLITLTGRIDGVVQAVGKLMETSNAQLGKLDNICQGGSGIIPVKV